MNIETKRIGLFYRRVVALKHVAFHQKLGTRFMLCGERELYQKDE